MRLEDLVQALLTFDTLAARQWVADAARAGIEWTRMPKPQFDTAEAEAVAASVADLLAQRNGETPPEWTREVGASPTTVMLVKAIATMPNLRVLCETEGPEPMRRRNILAPPEFLTIA